MPVSIEDGTAIAAALDDHLPLPEWPEVPRVFCSWLAPPLLSELVWGRECGEQRERSLVSGAASRRCLGGRKPDG